MENNCNVQPGDPSLVEEIVNQLKSQGIFDQWRKDCLADVDTKPAYQNLQQRVESTVARFLEKQYWNEKLNKNQLRERLRKHILSAGFLDKGLDRITDQVVDPKVNRVFLPVIKDTVYSHLGLENPDNKVDNASKPQPLMNLNMPPPGGGQQPGLFHMPNYQEEKKEEPVSDTEMALESSSSSSSSPTPPAYSPIGGGLPSPRSDSSPMRISPENITSSPSLPSPVIQPIPPPPRDDSDASSMDISYSPDAHNEGGRRAGDFGQDDVHVAAVEESVVSPPSPRVLNTSTSALSQISSDDSLPAEPSPPGDATPLLDEESQSSQAFANPNLPPPPPEALSPEEEAPPPPPPSEAEGVPPPPEPPLSEAPPPPLPPDEGPCPPLPPPSEPECPPSPPPVPPGEGIAPHRSEVEQPPVPPSPEEISAPAEPAREPSLEAHDITPSPPSGIVSPEPVSQKTSPSEDSDIEVRVMNVSASVRKMELREIVTVSPDSVSSVSLDESSPSPPRNPPVKPSLESMLSDISDSPEESLKKSPSDEGEIESDREKRKKDAKRSMKKGKGESDSGEISDSSPEVHHSSKKRERKRSTSSSSTSSSSESSSEDDRRRRPHDRDRDRGRDRDDYSRRSSYDRKDGGGRGDYQRGSYYGGSSSKDYYRSDVKGRQMTGEHKAEQDADSPGSSKENVTPERSEKQEKKNVLGEKTVQDKLLSDVLGQEKVEVLSVVEKAIISEVVVMDTTKEEAIADESVPKKQEVVNDVEIEQKDVKPAQPKDVSESKEDRKKDEVKESSKSSSRESNRHSNKSSRHSSSRKDTSRSSERKSDNKDRKHSSDRHRDSSKRSDSSDKRHGSSDRRKSPSRRSDDKKRDKSDSRDRKSDPKHDSKSSRDKERSKDSRSHSNDPKSRSHSRRDDKSSDSSRRSKSSSSADNKGKTEENDSKLTKKPKVAENFEEMRKVMKERKRLKELDKVESEAAPSQPPADVEPSIRAEKTTSSAEASVNKQSLKVEAPTSEKTEESRKNTSLQEPKPGNSVSQVVKNEVSQLKAGNLNEPEQTQIPDRAKLIQLAMRPPPGSKTICDMLQGKSVEDALLLLPEDPVVEEAHEDDGSVIPALDLYDFEEYRTWGKKTWMTVRIEDRTYSLRVANVNKAIHPLDLMKVEEKNCEEPSGKRVRKVNMRFIEDDVLAGSTSPARAKKIQRVKSPLSANSVRSDESDSDSSTSLGKGRKRKHSGTPSEKPLKKLKKKSVEAVCSTDSEKSTKKSPRSEVEESRICKPTKTPENFESQFEAFVSKNSVCRLDTESPPNTKERRSPLHRKNLDTKKKQPLEGNTKANNASRRVSCHSAKVPIDVELALATASPTPLASCPLARKSKTPVPVEAALPKPIGVLDRPVEQDGKRIRKLNTKYGDDFLMVPKSYKEAGEERLRASKVEDDDYSPAGKKAAAKRRDSVPEITTTCPKSVPKRQRYESSDSDSVKKELSSAFIVKKPTVMIPKPRTPKSSPTYEDPPGSANSPVDELRHNSPDRLRKDERVEDNMPSGLEKTRAGSPDKPVKLTENESSGQEKTLKVTSGSPEKQEVPEAPSSVLNGKNPNPSQERSKGEEKMLSRQDGADELAVEDVVSKDEVENPPASKTRGSKTPKTSNRQKRPSTSSEQESLMNDLQKAGHPQDIVSKTPRASLRQKNQAEEQERNSPRKNAQKSGMEEKTPRASTRLAAADQATSGAKSKTKKTPKPKQKTGSISTNKTPVTRMKKNSEADSSINESKKSPKRKADTDSSETGEITPPRENSSPESPVKSKMSRKKSAADGAKSVREDTPPDSDSERKTKKRKLDDVDEGDKKTHRNSDIAVAKSDKPDAKKQKLSVEPKQRYEAADLYKPRQSRTSRRTSRSITSEEEG